MDTEEVCDSFGQFEAYMGPCHNDASFTDARVELGQGRGAATDNAVSMVVSGVLRKRPGDRTLAVIHSPSHLETISQSNFSRTLDSETAKYLPPKSFLRPTDY